ncbi:MAG: helix-hairpin-helix domain-containing protein [Anaerolineaceae bacterium]|nr:helix-hairpin-helix domain-containing protein [Anaerolineaceae bacterium]
MVEEIKKINVNQASKKDLETIQGIGAVMAERIKAGQPYASFEDLLSIQKMNQKLLDQILPYITLSKDDTVHKEEIVEPFNIEEDLSPGRQAVLIGKPETDPDVMQEFIDSYIPQNTVITKAEEKKDFPKPLIKEKATTSTQPSIKKVSKVKESEPIKTDSPFLKPKTSSTHPPRAIQLFKSPENDNNSQSSSTFSKQEILTGATLAALLILVLSVVISLGFIGIINQGEWRYASQQTFSEQQRSIEDLQSQVDLLQEETNGLRDRLDTLETLSGRIVTLEDEDQILHAEIDMNTAALDIYQEEIEILDLEVEELRSQNLLFSSFLDGLRTLLNQIPEPTSP